jgi:hypothetical protein
VECEPHHGNIDPVTGIYTAPSSIVPASTATVTATLGDDPTVSASAVITLVPSGGSSGALPSEWQFASFGYAPNATATYGNGVFTMSAASNDMGGTSDSAGIAYQPLTGDGTVVARIAGTANAQSWTKTGIILRAVVSQTEGGNVWRDKYTGQKAALCACH